ncbi:hypothetical protein FSARC_5155 [Fusarium sarcochroum]|uniref:Beta-lactamase-related domain-containing protein n=1 Tax=Fusarium sarcochroum TaxID=1208366 RepID=A0A8H4TZZ6_9HYPO|nr:hypothetical protein FSARC_5155 [Fusarium sarcochroum]
MVVKHLLPLLLLAGDGLAAKNYHCPPLGAVLPAPTKPSSDSDVKDAVEALTKGLNTITGLLNSTAVSIGISSIHEDKPLLDFHHTPENLDPRGVSKVDADSVYRIGSVSKAYVVLALHKLPGVKLDDPVTKYVPQLRKLKKQAKEKNAIGVVDWDNVSLLALSSHMGGIPADLATEISSFPGNWTELGLPEADDLLGCGLIGIRPCNNKDFWDNFGKRPPTYVPWSNPVYANAAWLLLSFVIEKVSGESVEKFVQKNVLDVAGMKSTTYSKPDDSVGAIGPGDIFWNTSLGILDPAGSYYSSTKDILAFGSSILKHEQLDVVETNKLLKPVTFTSARGQFIGAPWEIKRSNNLTVDERIVEVYTKGGDLGTYHAALAMIPDYDIVISVLAGGPEASGGVINLLLSQVVKGIVPALEAAGKTQAKSAFAGKYVNKETNSTLILAVDDEGPGLNITEWIVRGTDVSAHWLNYLSNLQSGVPEIQIAGRLYPTDLAAGKRTAWRAVFRLGTVEEVAMEEEQFFWDDSSCSTWAVVDRAVYEFLGLDEMVFEVDDGGKAGEVELLGFQTTLKRVE